MSSVHYAWCDVDKDQSVPEMRSARQMRSKDQIMRHHGEQSLSFQHEEEYALGTGQV